MFSSVLNSWKQLTLNLTSIIEGLEGHACQVQLSLSSSEKADFVQNTITAVAETFFFFEWENSDKNAM